MASEIANYIDECYKVEQEEKLKDVYVTDHSVKETKYLTKSDEEDEELYSYQKALEEYNSSEKDSVFA